MSIYEFWESEEGKRIQESIILYRQEELKKVGKTPLTWQED